MGTRFLRHKMTCPGPAVEWKFTGDLGDEFGRCTGCGRQGVLGETAPEPNPEPQPAPATPQPVPVEAPSRPPKVHYSTRPGIPMPTPEEAVADYAERHGIAIWVFDNIVGDYVQKGTNRGVH